MRTLQNIAIALRALRINILRSLLTVLGIIIGVAAVIAMVAIGEGARTLIAEQIRSLGSNLLMVLPESPSFGAQHQGGSRYTLTGSDAKAIAQDVPGVIAASSSVRENARVVHGNRNWQSLITGTTSDYFLVREWAIKAGRLFSSEEGETASKVAVIGASVARGLFGEVDPVGEIVRIAGVPVTVIGVLAEKGLSGTGRDQDDVIFVPISMAKLRLVGRDQEVNRDSVAYILVKAEKAEVMSDVAQQIAALLRQRHHLRRDEANDFQVTNPAAAMTAQRGATRTLTFLLASVASVSLVVGGISIMNIMLVAVTERTREIGLRLAVGARRSDIRNQFLVEATALCVVGGAIGALLGILAAVLIASVAGWPAFIGPEAIVFAVCFAAVVGIFFGLYPAMKASKLNPIEALRFE